MPRFSLVVPTLSRADTLEHSLETLLAQAGEPDLEIVVQNNGDDPATRALVAHLSDPRLRHFHTDEVVPMTQNWELALANSTGELVTFIGDDDGLLPDACAVAALVFDAADLEVLSWEPFLYLWPSYWDEHRRNRLQARVAYEFRVDYVASRPLLEQLYAFETHYSRLPMIYNSFVRRSLIDRVRDRYGAYFLGSLPDLTSGVVNVACTETFARSSRPLSVAGLSGHSTGSRWTRAETRLSREAVERDFPVLAEQEEVSAAPSLERVIGTELALIEEQVRECCPVVFSNRGLVRAMAASVNDSPAHYDETRAAILALAERIGLGPEDVTIPPRLDRPPAPADGVHVLGPYEVLFVLDGNRIGLRTIADAVRLAAQLVPARDALVSAEPTPAPPTVPSLSAEPLSFAKSSPGTTALLSGWGEPESWGTWSIERESVLRVRLPVSDEDRAVRMGLRFRTVPVPDGRRRFVDCAVGERMVERWQFTDEYEGELVIELPAGAVSDHEVELTFMNRNAQSPKEMGVGEDTRRLGIGVEAMRLLPIEREPDEPAGQARTDA